MERKASVEWKRMRYTTPDRPRRRRFGRAASTAIVVQRNSKVDGRRCPGAMGFLKKGGPTGRGGLRDGINTGPGFSGPADMRD